jgi:hypothetical protein
MGNDSSLPSLDRMGRPFGTGRLPNSFTRQVDRQLETGVPVERLEGRREAGGARRARKNEQPGTRRGKRGPRAEEVRAERQASSETSRRQDEASARTRRSSRPQAGASSSADATRRGSEDRPRDFGSELRARSEAEPKQVARRSHAEPTSEQGGAAKAKSEVPKVVTSGQPTILATQLKAPAPPGPALVAAPSAKAPVAQAPTLSHTSGVDSTAKAESRAEASEAPKPEQAQRWSESEAAERASAVLRQLRVNMNPALRSATVQLAPADLGRLSIKLRVQDGRVHAEVRAETVETLSILERHIPELQASLASSGLEVEGFELSLGMGDEGSGASDDAAAQPQASTPGESSGDVTIEPELLARAVARRSGLDTYA